MLNNFAPHTQSDIPSYNEVGNDFLLFCEMEESRNERVFGSYQRRETFLFSILKAVSLHIKKLKATFSLYAEREKVKSKHIMYLGIFEDGQQFCSS